MWSCVRDWVAFCCYWNGFLFGERQKFKFSSRAVCVALETLTVAGKAVVAGTASGSARCLLSLFSTSAESLHYQHDF